MAPNANTHLLTPRDYFRHPPPWEYGGVVLQLDLGDGATHTPRPGSRARRSSGAPGGGDLAQAMSCLGRSEDDELRAAIEMSVVRAYSGHRASTLPHADRHQLGVGSGSRHLEPPHLSVEGRGSPMSPAPRRRPLAHLHDYRVEGYGSASTSRGHSPNNYA